MSPNKKHQRPQVQRTALRFETLDRREMMAAAVDRPPAYTNVAGSVLQVVGDENHNSAKISRSGDKLIVRIESTPSNGFSLVPTVVDKVFSAVGITQIRFWGYEGNDVFESAAGLPCTWIDGGDGNDVLSGSDLNDVIVGGLGDDILIGKGGNDEFRDAGGNNQVFGGDGVDSGYFSKAGSATTDVEMARIDVPGGNPQGRNQCGPNSAWRMLRAFGGTASEQQLISSANRSSNPSVFVSNWGLGTTGNVLKEAMNANRRGVGSTTFDLATDRKLSDVLTHLRSGRPVVALIGTQDSRRGVEGTVGEFVDVVVGEKNNKRFDDPNLHWITVTGVDESTGAILYTDTDGRKYQMSQSEFSSQLRWNFDDVSMRVLKSLGVVPGTFIYAETRTATNVDQLIKALPMLDGNSLKMELDRLSANVLVIALPQLDSATIRAAASRMDSQQLLGVLTSLEGESLTKVLNQCSSSSLAPVVTLAPWGTSMRFLNRLNDELLTAVVAKLDGKILDGVLDRIALDRLIAIFPRLDGATLKASLQRMDANQIAKVLPNVDTVTIRASTNRVDSQQLRDVVAKLGGDQLTKVLRNTAVSRLVPVVEMSGASTAVRIYRQLEANAQKELLSLVDAPTRKTIKSRI